nr:reverse transcriptase domain-containing protein [Tanacetum cinerariifolium]
MSWNDFKFMMIEEFCPSHEMQKLETELWNHAMVGAGHAAYTDRFHELARLVPHLVTPASRKIERYVYGLDLQIRRMVVATEPNTMQKAVQISGALTDEAVMNGSIKKVEKRENVEEPRKDKNVIHNTTQPQMSDMTVCLNDLSYIPPNNEQNKQTQEDIGETSNEPTQAKRNDFKELYANANEELYLGFVHEFLCVILLVHIQMSAAVGRGHGGDDDPSRPPSGLIRIGCRGVGGRKPNKGGRVAGILGTMLHLGDHAAQWSNLVGEIIREFLMYYPSSHKIKEEKKAGVLRKLMMQSSKTQEYRPSSRPSSTHILMTANLRRTRREFNKVLAEKGRDAISINEPQCTHNDVDVDE